MTTSQLLPHNTLSSEYLKKTPTEPVTSTDGSLTAVNETKNMDDQQSNVFDDLMRGVPSHVRNVWIGGAAGTLVILLFIVTFTVCRIKRTGRKKRKKPKNDMELGSVRARCEDRHEKESSHYTELGVCKANPSNMATGIRRPLPFIAKGPGTASPHGSYGPPRRQKRQSLGKELASRITFRPSPDAFDMGSWAAEWHLTPATMAVLIAEELTARDVLLALGEHFKEEASCLSITVGQKIRLQKAIQGLR